MSDKHLKVKKPRVDDSRKEALGRAAPANDKPAWETPKMEDVSREVMAQPYIRFT